MVSAASDAFRDALRDALHPAYELGRELAGGGMARVFVAEERALGRTVVVKVLPPDLAAGVNRERFRREIQLAARLQHPHIVPLLSAGEADGSLWYTMPFIEGESLRERVRVAAERGERLGVREVLRILHDVVEALAYAHARGVVHRDVKPGNVLMLGSHALVTDFGVAKALSASKPHSGTTSIGLAIGTPAYMAPEQLAADPAADHRMDIYAAGLLAYELLAGGSPFASASPQATLAAQLTRVPEPLHTLRPDVPPALSAIVMRCLEKEPSLRPAAAEALLAELEQVSGGGWGSVTSGEREGGSLPLAGGASVTSGPTVAIAPMSAGDARTVTAATAAVPAPHAPARRRPQAAALVAAGLALAMVGGGAWALARRSRPAESAPASSASSVSAAASASAPATAVVTTPAAEPAGAAAAPAPPAAPPAPPVSRLTRDDSLAIAAAVERRLAQEERARRAKQQRELSPEEAEAMRSRAWDRYADSVGDAVRRQFGPDFVREMTREAMKGGGVVVRVPDVPAAPGMSGPGAAGGPRGARGRGRDAGAPPVAVPYDPEELAARARAGRMPHPEAAPRVHVIPGTPAVPGVVGTPTPAVPRPSAVAERIAAQVAPPRAGVKRVVLLEMANSTGRPELAPLAESMAGALARKVASSDGYELADPRATRLALAAGLRSGAVAAATHSGAAVYGNVLLARDHVTYLVQIWDARRNYAKVVRARRPLEGGDEAKALAELADKVQEQLADWVRWEPKEP